MSRREFWVSQRGIPRQVTEAAPRLEDQGWDGITLTDNQNLTGDCIIALTLAVQATRRVSVMPGVINPVTRHPAVLAAAAANLYDISDGRFVMAVGRGDSSLAYLGMAPMPVGRFEVAVRQLSRLLKGDSISLEDAASFGGAPPIASLGYANLPAASSIEWMAEGTKIPLEVVGTGPRLISVGARHADRISFAVGADPARLRWAVGLARDEAERAGRKPSELSFGCYVQAVCHPDRDYATDIGRGVVATLARFMSLGGAATVPVRDEDRAVIEQITSRYDMTKHGHHGDQIKVIDDDFAQRFSVLGPPTLCRERFEELFDAGCDRIIVMPVNSGTHEDQRASLELLATEVLPHFRPVEAR